MNNTEVNILVSLCVLLLCLKVIKSHVKINNKILDFLFIACVLIISRKYLKISLMLLFLLFLVKFNLPPSTENFSGNLEDDDDDDEDEDENKTNTNTNDTETKPESESVDKSDGDSYTEDCMKRCKKTGKEITDCNEICNIVCPNPHRYNENLKLVEKLKHLFENPDN